jgi:hypothetical protein
MGVADRLRAAFARDDFEGMIGVLDEIVVDMHLVESPPDLDLHQVLTIREDRVVHIQDCPDRATALAEAGLS